MSIRKRVQKIETSLTPREMALFWLESILNFDQRSHFHDLWLDPRGFRDIVAKKVAEAVRENLTEPPLKREVLELAVREAQKQTDTLMVLILDLHQHVRSQSCLNHLMVDLVIERYLH